MGQTSDALDARKAALENAGIAGKAGGGGNETHDQSPEDTEKLSQCIATLMKSGTPRDEAQKQCLANIKQGITPKKR